MTRRLALTSEVLADLTSEELSGVVGGALPTTPLEVCLRDSEHVCNTYTRGIDCSR